jgi:hypothetical protein
MKTANRIAEMQIPIHKWLSEELADKPHDEGPGEGVTEQNSTKSRGSSDNLYKLHPDEQDPFPDCGDSNTSPDIGAAMTELLNHSSPLPHNKTSVVALTCARNSDLASQIAHVWNAADSGIRMHFGILPSQSSLLHPKPRPYPQPALTGQIREQDLIAAVLHTGGTYSTLHNRAAIPRFLDHVISRGLTHYDNAPDTAILLPAGLTITDHITPDSEPRRFSFDASYTANVVVSVAPLSPKLALHIQVRHVRRNIVLQEQFVGLGGSAEFRAELDVDDVPRTDAWFELEVAHARGRGLVGGGLFEVGIEMEGEGGSKEGKGVWGSEEGAEGRWGGKEQGAHDEL